ncbi:MAG: PAS domain S-box protein [Deltaproteobacteria bacterium]|nr:PAS domain S-box protein [Deltaproteobacteria bacterium]
MEVPSVLETALLAASVLLQAVAALLALRLVRIPGGRVAGLTLTAAFVLMVARRAIVLYAALGEPAARPASLATELIGLAISALMVVGTLAVTPMFRARHEATRRLAESEQRYRTLVETANDAVFLADAETGLLLEVNQRAAELMGIPRERLIGMPHYRLHPPEDEARYREVFRKHVAEGRSVPGADVVFVQHADGRRIPIDISANVTELDGRRVVQGRFQDATRREDVAQALRDSERRLQQLMLEFRAVLDAIPDNITLQSRDLVVRWANRGAARSVDREPEQLVGGRCHELWHGSDEPCPRCPVLRSFRSGRNESDVASTPDGRSWELRAVPIVDERGEVTGVVEVARNITDLRNLEAQLLQAQKMEAVGRLAGGIAHDFNNLLSAILGYAEMLRLRLKDDDQAREDVDGVRQTVEQAAALTRQLLAFSSKQVVHPRVVDLNEIVGAAQPLLRRLLGEDVAVRAALAPEPATVHADPGQLEQVLLNLAVNARDAMPRGGTLTLTVSETSLAADEAERLELSPGRHVVLSVRDTGTGIPPEARTRLFEPFFTTKSKGTGLGLSITLGIVKEYGGTMTVESPPEGGATFRIHLPLAEGAPERPTGRFRVTAPGPRGTETVLLVEDDDALRRLTRTALASHGYTVLDAGDAVEGLAAAERHRGSLALLVTDVVLPRGNGRVLAEQVRARRPGIRVLFISGYTADTALPLGADQPGTAFLQKPFGPEDLARRVRKVLDEPHRDP